MSKKGEVLGIITDGDLRRMLNLYKDTSNLNASMIMSKNPKSVESEVLAADALKIMRAHSINQLVVMNGDVYLGLIHIHDILSKGL